MRILVINPNTTVEMTKQVEAALNKVKQADTILDVTNPSSGPDGLASACDEIVSGYEVLKIIRNTKIEDYDGAIVACYSDPGLVAAKEICDIPVVGIAETCIHFACLLGRKFTVLTSSRERIPSKELYVRNAGLESRLASVRALGVSVVETTHDPARPKDAILEVGKKAVVEDGAEVLILGCAGMAGYAEDVEEQLGVPVLDPSAVALKTVEGMVRLGKKQSKVAYFAQPPKLCV
jgi:allantoin racemase